MPGNRELTRQTRRKMELTVHGDVIRAHEVDNPIIFDEGKADEQVDSQ